MTSSQANGAHCVTILRGLSRRTSPSWGTDEIGSDIQIVRQEIGALKAAAKREAPFEVRGRTIGLAWPLNRGRPAGPIKIRVHVVERTDSDVRCRDHGHSLAKGQLVVEQISHRILVASAFVAGTA